MSLSPKIASDIKEGGGRHFRGRGLGTLQQWKCPACGVANVGPLGTCANCGAGAPGQQVWRPGDPLVKADPDGKLETVAGGREERTGQPGGRGPTARPAAPPPSAARGKPATLTAQLRSRPPAVDYDEIERRVLHALDARLGGGFSDAERATLYMALECYTALWEDGTIEPSGGLTLQRTRELMAKIAPDTGLEMNERPEEPDATDTQPTQGHPEQADQAGDDADSRRIWDDDDQQRAAALGEPSGHDPIVARRHPDVAAPQYVDLGDRADQGGQDDPAGDGE